jgi:hypothetical protein
MCIRDRVAENLPIGPLCLTIRKPFDVLVKGLLVPDSEMRWNRQ